MAYQFDEEDDQEQAQAGVPQGSAQTAPMTAGPVGGVATPAAAPQVAPAPAQAPTGGAQGRQFVNFDRLLNANRSNAQQMAGGVATAANTAGEAYTSAVNDGFDKFTADVAQAGTVRGSLKATPATGHYENHRQSSFDSAGYNPTFDYTYAQFRPNEAVYKGPASFDAFAANQGGYQKQLSAAQQAVKAASDPYLMQAQLQKQHGTTRAGSAFDSALAMGGGRDQLQAVNTKFGKLNEYMSGKSKAGEGLVGEAKAKIDATNANLANTAADMTKRAKEKAQAKARAAWDAEWRAANGK